MPLKGQQKPWQGEKSGGKPKGDQVVHLKGWIVKAIGQLGSKVVKSKGNKGNMAKHVNVIYQQRGKTQRKNNKRDSQSMKMSKSKKRPNEQVTFICAQRQKDQKQLSPGYDD